MEAKQADVYGQHLNILCAFDVCIDIMFRFFSNVSVSSPFHKAWEMRNVILVP